MDSGAIMDNAHARSVARSIWGLDTINDQERIPIWLDCDTGHDDAFAVLLVTQCPRFRILGISTVHGNSSLQNTTRNTLSVLEAIGRRDVPVYPGSAKPFCRQVVHAESIHGESGLDGTTVLPAPIASASRHEASTIGAIYASLSAYPGKSWLVSTGSLTNIALLFSVYPDLADKIAGLSIMGGVIGGFFTNAPLGRTHERLVLGSNLYRVFPGGLPDESPLTIPELAELFEQQNLLQNTEGLDDETIYHILEEARFNFGNISPFAEFNIYCDPEAACSIFSNTRLACKTTLIPLDLTHQVLATEEILSMIKYGSESADTKKTSLVRQLFYEIVTFFASTYDREFKMPSPPLHDPVAVVAALQPDLFDDADGERFSIHVVREGDGSNIGQCGRTIIKMLDKGAPGIRIPRTLQVAEFWHLIDKSLRAAEMSKSRQN